MEGIIDAAIMPVLKECGFKEPLVSHRIQNSGSMTAEIIKGIYDSDLVIANLTDNNANVMYEVAIRHCAGKPIVHITENIDTIPFDINDHRCIEYTNDAMGVIELKEELKKKINHILENPDAKVSNPVLDHLQKVKIIEEPGDVTISMSKSFAELNRRMDNLDLNLKMLKTSIRNDMMINRNRQLYRTKHNLIDENKKNDNDIIIKLDRINDKNID